MACSVGKVIFWQIAPANPEAVERSIGLNDPMPYLPEKLAPAAYMELQSDSGMMAESVSSK